MSRAYRFTREEFDRYRGIDAYGHCFAWLIAVSLAYHGHVETALLMLAYRVVGLVDDYLNLEIVENQHPKREGGGE